MGYRELPGSLGAALEQMEGSELVAEALPGEHVFDFFLRNKRAQSGRTTAATSRRRVEDLPVALAGRDTACATVVDVAKPATQRPKLPSVGRLGLVEPSAPADLTRLGWNTKRARRVAVHPLSRAPDADVALKTMVRVAEASGRDWDNSTTRCSRTRDSGVGCSVCWARHWRWATTWRHTRGPGICWQAT